MRRRGTSTSITLTRTSSPTERTLSGDSMCCSEISEMCTRPSIPAATRTNAPNGTSLVTWPSMISPAEYFRSNSFHGSSWVALSDSDTRSRSRSTSSTSTSTSWPTWTTSLGWSTCFHESSDTCTRPSTPPRSTNAPKFTIEETVPLRRSPFCSDSRNFLRPSLCDSSRKARRESTTLLRLRSSSMILASSSVPTNGCRSRTRRRSTSEAGRNPGGAGAVCRAARLPDLLDPAPGALVLRALLRQDQAALFVLLLEHEGLDLVADLHDLAGVELVADGQSLVWAA